MNKVLKFLKKFNIIDWILILVFIFSVTLGIYKVFILKEPEKITVFKAGGEIVEPEKTATVKYKIRNIREIAAEKLENGAECYYLYGDVAGKMKNISKEKYSEYALNDENEFIKYEYDDKYNVYFEMELEGRHTRSAFNGADWAPVGAGTLHYYLIEGTSFECTVIDVKLNN